uniref:NADH-ubiquinone oxidoreductase chain 4L n=1 Tax=Tinaminyssus melloi TaxID=105222 RepID=A0A5Q0RZ35_9ACAR|nr:NADH dehydrogenase subunit 4L [Tinaminyssus melloi]QGA47514.1 NADH dehydrogenase subunit 4L [Tinaminyssus melloi]
MIFSIYLWLFGLFSAVYWRESLLMILLSLELMLVGVFYQLIFVMSLDNVLMLVIYMMSMVVESCMSLTLLVLIVYYYGSDMGRSYDLFSV